jgi:hypothetical protein
VNLGKPSVVVNDRSPNVGNLQQYKPTTNSLFILTKMAGEFSTSKNKYVHYKSRNVEGNEEIDFGLALEKVSLGPRKKLLVMNLGGWLCQRVCRREVHNIPRFRHPDASYGSMLGENLCF